MAPSSLEPSGTALTVGLPAVPEGRLVGQGLLGDLDGAVEQVEDDRLVARGSRGSAWPRPGASRASGPLSSLTSILPDGELVEQVVDDRPLAPHGVEQEGLRPPRRRARPGWRPGRRRTPAPRARARSISSTATDVDRHPDELRDQRTARRRAIATTPRIARAEAEGPVDVAGRGAGMASNWSSRATIRASWACGMQGLQRVACQDDVVWPVGYFSSSRALASSGSIFA